MRRFLGLLILAKVLLEIVTPGLQCPHPSAQNCITFSQTQTIQWTAMCGHSPRAKGVGRCWKIWCSVVWLPTLGAVHENGWSQQLLVHLRLV